MVVAVRHPVACIVAVDRTVAVADHTAAGRIAAVVAAVAAVVVDHHFRISFC